MKPILLGCLLPCSVVACAQDLPVHPRQCDTPVVNTAIQQVITDWKSGCNEGDPDKVARLRKTQPILLSTLMTGIVHGRDAIKAYVKALGFNLVVLQKRQGKWLIVAHESAVPDTATAIQKLDLGSH